MQPASPGPLVQIHISLATTITPINLGGAGKGLRAGHWEVAVPEVSALPRPGSNGHSAAAASTPTHCLPHSQQRQEEASAQRKAAQEAGPPPLPAPSLPPRRSSGADAILKPPGLCPQAGSARTVNRWIHKDTQCCFSATGLAELKKKKKSQAFYSTQAPRRPWGGGATPPHILSNRLRCCAASATAKALLPTIHRTRSRVRLPQGNTLTTSGSLDTSIRPTAFAKPNWDA